MKMSKRSILTFATVIMLLVLSFFVGYYFNEIKNKKLLKQIAYKILINETYLLLSYMHLINIGNSGELNESIASELMVNVKAIDGLSDNLNNYNEKILQLIAIENEHYPVALWGDNDVKAVLNKAIELDPGYTKELRLRDWTASFWTENHSEKNSDGHAKN